MWPKVASLHVSAQPIRRSKYCARVCGGPDGMTAGGGACSDGPSLACLRVEAFFFVVCPLKWIMIVALFGLSYL